VFKTALLGAIKISWKFG